MALQPGLIRLLIAGYLLFQAAGIGLWWCWLWLVPDSIDWFQPPDWPRQAMLGFWLADLALLVGGSYIAAIGVWRETRWASSAIWLLAAAASYPTLYCLGVSSMTGQAWIASAMMASMTGLTLVMASILGSGNQLPAVIRVTRMSRSASLAWTLLQTAIFWSVFLWILPMGIFEFEQRMGVAQFHHPGQAMGSLALFLIASALGLWSGVTMATTGEGTPLPTATAPRLVNRGPYRAVRNPMALAGILQGMAVGWWLGSISVMILSLVGAVLWHCLVRPVEEADLEARFGEDYRRYRESTGLWILRR